MKSWQVFHDRLLLGSCFGVCAQPVLDYCSAVWCSSTDTHLKLLDRIVSGVRFLTSGVFERDLAHRRSVALLHYVCCTISGVTRCTVVMVLYLCRICAGACCTRCCDSHRYTHASSRSRTSQYPWNFILLSVSLWNDLCDPMFDGVGLAGFKRRPMPFH